jgi:hypothetical protein
VLALGASNLALASWRRRAGRRGRMLAAVMFLDVGLLTAVLYFTGGPSTRSASSISSTSRSRR